MIDSIHKLIQSSWSIYLIFIISFALYANTLFHEFVLDDRVVFTENQFVQNGLNGIGKIFSNETFAGYFKDSGRKSTVGGGRYRPLTLAFFAVQHQVNGNNPFTAHLFNILFYGLLNCIVFICLSKLLSYRYPQQAKAIAFIAALLFAIHPLHTEVVANIKGLDEIWSLLFSFTSLYFLLKTIETKKLVHGIASGIFFILALFSKENAIVFLALMPLAIYLFIPKEIKRTWFVYSPLLISAAFFIGIRIWVLGASFINSSRNFLENPWLQFRGERLVEINPAEKYGTIFYTLLRYVYLNFIPYPLTHDYAPKSIASVNLFSPLPILAIALAGTAIFLALKWRTSKPIYTWSIALFMIALIPTSNLFFSIGAYMGERFVFVSSLGICIMLAAFLLRFLQARYSWSIYLLPILLIAFSTRTIARNTVWKNNFSLFNSDYEHSSNSAKLNSSLGFTLLENYRKSDDKEANKYLVNQAIFHLKKALEIYPNYTDCIYLLGNAYYIIKDHKDAVATYEQYITMSPGDMSIMKNYQKALREYGRYLFHEEHNNQEAKQVLIKSLKLNPNDDQALELLGSAEAELGYLLKSLEYLTKASQINPQSASVWANLYITYTRLGDKPNAQIAINKGMEIDKDVVKKLMTVKVK